MKTYTENDKIGFKKIKEFYIRIHALLVENKIDEASKVLHQEMPITLYDRAIDLMFENNDNILTEELKHLIQKVDNKFESLVKHTTTIDNSIGSSNKSRPDNYIGYFDDGKGVVVENIEDGEEISDGFFEINEEDY